MPKKGDSTKTSIIFNFGGRIWIALIGLFFVPLYLRYLSVEVYGIIGFFTSIQVVLSLLDGGISPTLNREVARLSVFPDKAREMRDLSWTLEVLSWGIAVIVGGAALILSPIVAYYWLHPETLSVQTVYQALMLMSVSFAFQWAINFYTSGFLGLQRQKLYNLLNCLSVTFRSVGAYLVLVFVSPSIQAFLLWQVFSVVLSAVVMAIAYRKALPHTGSRSKFDLNLLRGIWRYAAGMTGVTLVSLVLTQSDKIVLSRLLTLEYFGYYTLASTLAGSALGIVTGSVGSAYFPKFSQLVALGDNEKIKFVYHQSCQVMSVLLIPTALVIAFFSYDILLLWTRNERIAGNSYILLSLVAIGTGLNGLMHLPYFIQLANGLTKLTFWQNIIAIVLLVPFMIFATRHYGAVGGALTWVILNLFYILVGMQVMNRFLLRGELGKWYVYDIGRPLLAGLAAITIGSILFSVQAPALYKLVWLSGTVVLAILLSILVLPGLKRTLFEMVRTRHVP